MYFNPDKYITRDEANRVLNMFNNQEGQSYPCGNQRVCCGYFTPYDWKWERFVDQNMENIKIRTKSGFLLNNGDNWIRIPFSSNIRGQRYYKAKIDRHINRDFFITEIMPNCYNYCCNFEWI